jgi:hypothetical protein
MVIVRAWASDRGRLYTINEKRDLFPGPRLAAPGSRMQIDILFMAQTRHRAVGPSGRADSSYAAD